MFPRFIDWFAQLQPLLPVLVPLALRLLQGSGPRTPPPAPRPVVVVLVFRR